MGSMIEVERELVLNVKNILWKPTRRSKTRRPPGDSNDFIRTLCKYKYTFQINTLQAPDHSKVVSRDSLEGTFEPDGFSLPTEAFLWGPVFVLLGLGESSGGLAEVRFSGIVEG